MTDEPQSADEKAANRARSDGLASVAIILVAVAMLVFLATRIL
ncbi:MAG: hypothetical protein P8N02_07010 [Actinomycetota bacterium]|nr:hypothetical protein [Actinomycetota bacterium]